MKLFGYPKEGNDEPQSIELSDVTVAAKPEELRKIAKFFEQAAIDIEESGTDFEHEHLQDNQEGFDGDSDIQIFNEALL